MSSFEARTWSWMIIIDYLQLFKEVDEVGENRQQEVSEISVL